MQLNTVEFGELADMLSSQKIVALEQKVAEAREEAALWQHRYEMASALLAASELKSMLLTNYILLSADKIKKFVEGLNSVERWAFLRTFMQWSLPEELQARELPLIDKVMPMPQTDGRATTNNYYEAGSGCQVFNDKVTGRFEGKENDGREEE